MAENTVELIIPFNLHLLIPRQIPSLYDKPFTFICISSIHHSRFEFLEGILMASVFVYHVVGDLTAAKPELVEFEETETVESAIRAIRESTENGIPVWRRKSLKDENTEMRQQRFVGILKSLHIVAFLAGERCLEDQERAMKTPVSEIVVPNNSLLREVDPATRLVDALDMMKQGVQRLLVPKGVPGRGVSKKFSVLSDGRWMKNTDSSIISTTAFPSTSWLTSPSPPLALAPGQAKFCCLSREDVLRFLIGFLGALDPIPLSSISTLGAINPHYCSIEVSKPAIESAKRQPHSPTAIAVVDTTLEGCLRIIGDISSCKLWKCDYLAAAYALASLSAGEFVMGVEEKAVLGSVDEVEVGSMRPGMFSSKSTGFLKNLVSQTTSYRGRGGPLTCRPTSSLAAVMAQMLSHHATHVWVTEGESNNILVGVIGYSEIMYAMTIPLPACLS